MRTDVLEESSPEESTMEDVGEPVEPAKKQRKTLRSSVMATTAAKVGNIISPEGAAQPAKGAAQDGAVTDLRDHSHSQMRAEVDIHKLMYTFEKQQEKFIHRLHLCRPGKDGNC